MREQFITNKMRVIAEYNIGAESFVFQETEHHISITIRDTDIA